MTYLILAGSIAGVLVLVLIAWWLGLGGGAIGGEAEACRAAEDSQFGFVAEAAIVAADGQAAVVRGRDGSVLLLKVHGAHLAARRLAPLLRFTPVPDGVMVATGERMFGDLRLRLSPEDRDKLLTLLRDAGSANSPAPQDERDDGFGRL